MNTKNLIFFFKKKVNHYPLITQALEFDDIIMYCSSIILCPKSVPIVHWGHQLDVADLQVLASYFRVKKAWGLRRWLTW